MHGNEQVRVEQRGQRYLGGLVWLIGFVSTVRHDWVVEEGREGDGPDCAEIGEGGIFF